eukprot:scaffold81335_cov19-Prasinocladus_malaysianus.AAC.1
MVRIRAQDVLSRAFTLTVCIGGLVSMRLIGHAKFDKDLSMDLVVIPLSLTYRRICWLSLHCSAVLH